MSMCSTLLPNARCTYTLRPLECVQFLTVLCGTEMENHHTANFIKSLLISHLAVSVHIVSFPDETRLIPTSLLDMSVQAVMADIGLTSFEELSEDLSFAHIKVVTDVLLIPLQYKVILSVHSPELKALAALELGAIKDTLCVP